MAGRNFQKYLCFSIDLTVATRIIAFTGIAVSILLVTVLLNDVHVKNFHISRKIALGLGLDWRHIHSKVDSSEVADPEGKTHTLLKADSDVTTNTNKISWQIFSREIILLVLACLSEFVFMYFIRLILGKIIIILFAVYSVLFFATNITLLLGAILTKPYLAIPWLTCEFVGSLSKLIGLLYHFISSERNDLNNIFIIGSIIYILVTIWWWVVVYTAQITWKEEKRFELELSTFQNETRTEMFDSILLNSPESYSGNILYTTI